MKHFFVFLALIALSSCGGEKTDDVSPNSSVEFKEDYEKVDGQYFRAFYGSNDQLKTEGMYDKEEKRHGVWTQYFLDGRKQSIIEYKHGLKDGFSLVYHENGSLYYRGEYKDDQMVGQWDFYDVKTGNKSQTKDYGYPKQ